VAVLQQSLNTFHHSFAALGAARRLSGQGAISHCCCELFRHGSADGTARQVAVRAAGPANIIYLLKRYHAAEKAANRGHRVVNPPARGCHCPSLDVRGGHPRATVNSPSKAFHPPGCACCRSSLVGTDSPEPRSTCDVAKPGSGATGQSDRVTQRRLGTRPADFQWLTRRQLAQFVRRTPPTSDQKTS